MPPIAILSHATRDADLAARLARDLTAAGINVRYAEWAMADADSLRGRLDAGIQGVTHFLVLLTPANVYADWVVKELDEDLASLVAARCQLIVLVERLAYDDILGALRSAKWVFMEPYADGVRQLVEACLGIPAKPPPKPPPVWTKERPLPESGLSQNGQRLAAWLSERASEGHCFVRFDRALFAKDLGYSGPQAAAAARELANRGLVELLGSGPPGFTQICPRPQLFFRTDRALRGWITEADAKAVAVELVKAGTESVSLEDLDRQLGWGPRRLNPAADYLRLNGVVRNTAGARPAYYSYAIAIVTPRTREFASL